MLNEYRKKIDLLDRQIIDLISERAEIVAAIGAEKHKSGLELYQPEREQQVYRKIAEMNRGQLDNDSLFNIYREIMSAALKHEGAFSVGYLGPEATFSHSAAIKKFGSSLPTVPFETIDAVFEAVHKKKIQYGVVPIENSTDGMINPTLDCLIEYDLKIVSEVNLPIRQHLMSLASNIQEITTIITIPPAYAQCRRWVIRNLPKAEWQPASSTAEAARIVAEKKDAAFAAIGPEAASIAHSLPILEHDIHDYNRNVTRFIVIGREETKPSGHDRTLLSFVLPDSAGALYQALEPFSQMGVNMRSIESRPLRGQLWSYVFFTDIVGHIHEPELSATIEKVKKRVNSLRILGSYPVDITHSEE
ncbi:MAG: prephenate dehydratase [Leptospiraceae bacterium]|nr:prephenate dehydratase [Leptospiraceae bacterium]